MPLYIGGRSASSTTLSLLSSRSIGLRHYSVLPILLSLSWITQHSLRYQGIKPPTHYSRAKINSNLHSSSSLYSLSPYYSSSFLSALFSTSPSTLSSYSNSIEESRSNMRPSVLVNELDRYIIGQNEAKRAVSVALRNRWRRHRLPSHLRNEVMPKNILMIGPTGWLYIIITTLTKYQAVQICHGKTEIARRLAVLTDSPFIKIEATKFTETGFHGRDVDSIISDLVRIAIQQMKGKKKKLLRQQIKEKVEDKILDALVGQGYQPRNDFLTLLRNKSLDLQPIDVEVPVKNESDTGNSTSAGLSSNERAFEFTLRGLVGSAAFGRGKREVRHLTIRDARPLMEESELESVLNESDVTKEAIKAVEEDGIVFLDEIDKICSPPSSHKHADASAEGVQRDLLPLIEGTTITTKQGDVNTDHILFICSGAFHSVSPSDMIAELQGRLPIRVELKQLTEEELYQILTKTENNLIKQTIALLAVDGVKLTFTDESIREIARVSYEVNRTVENIGARRLSTVVERLVDDYSYSAADGTIGTEILIDKGIVQQKVAEFLNKQI